MSEHRGRCQYGPMGVNLRLFEPDVWKNLPRRLIDGVSY